MATTKSANENFSMDEFDELLSALSADDLEKVNDLIDPEVDSYLFFLFQSTKTKQRFPLSLEFIFTS